MDLPVAENAGITLVKNKNATAAHMAPEVVIPTATHYRTHTTNHLALRHYTDEPRLCRATLYTASLQLRHTANTCMGAIFLRSSIYFSPAQWQHLRSSLRLVTGVVFWNKPLYQHSR